MMHVRERKAYKMIYDDRFKMIVIVIDEYVKRKYTQRRKDLYR